MFENLKAFIRHGRQANDLKKNVVNQPSLPTGGTNDIGYDADRSETMEPNGLFNLPSKGTISDFTLVTGDEVSNRKYQTKETKNYQEVATHIVEQEKLQKQKSIRYPNLNNYVILDRMGEGAFSIVYKARHLPTGELVAIKVLRKFQMDQVQKQSVLKEVTIMRQLSHPNIVKFIEFIDSEQYYYIVQELASGGEIFGAIVKYTYFSEKLSRHIITQVAHAIRYLHEEVGIVHRDIKPENLLYIPIEFKPSVNPIAKLRKSDDPNTKLDEGELIPGIGGGTIGVVKLADFGLSKQIWEHNTKTPCGTVGYTAPEIVRDEKYSKEVDMWAIGCVLYTLLCGFPPFYDERIEALTEKVAKGEYTFLSPWWDEISLEAKHCVSKLLTVDPSKRYTIDEFLRDPWMLNAMSPSAKSLPASSNDLQHPIQSINAKYSKKFMSNNDLYSPAAVALRDAFDISTAVHRMGEEAALSSKLGVNAIQDLVEEEEENEEFIDKQGHVLYSVISRTDNKQQHHHSKPTNKMFDLNLGSASILERRKNKQITIKS